MLRIFSDTIRSFAFWLFRHLQEDSGLFQEATCCLSQLCSGDGFRLLLGHFSNRELRSK